MPASKERIVEALQAEDSPLRAEGVALAVDHVLGTPLRELLDLREVGDLVLAAITRDNVERIVGRHVEPGFERYARRVAGAPEKLGDLVPGEERPKIQAIVQASRLPRAEWAKGMVDPVLLRKLLGPVWTGVLVSFAKRVTLPGGTGTSGPASGAFGIAGRLSKSVQERAERIVDAGRSVMGGLGAEFEKRLQATARDFSDGALDVFREALRERLASEEGQELAHRISGQIVERVLGAPLSALHEDARRVPLDRVFGVVPGVVAHAASTEFVRSIVFAEVDAFLATEGDRVLSDVLRELGVLDAVRQMALARVDTIARGLASAPGFADWVGRLLDA